VSIGEDRNGQQQAVISAIDQSSSVNSQNCTCHNISTIVLIMQDRLENRGDKGEDLSV